MHKITDFLVLHNIRIDLSAKDKDELIFKMVNLSCNDTNSDLTKIKEVVEEREEIFSTGIGRGVAIPHCKTNLIQGNKLALAILQTPVDYNSNDKVPVNIVFILISNDELLDVHLKLLSRICRLIAHSEFKERLISAITTEEIFDIIQQEENKISNERK